jgi:hypothetical protein
VNKSVVQGQPKREVVMVVVVVAEKTKDHFMPSLYIPDSKT